MTVDDRSVTLTSLDRVLWPRAGFTKGAMIDYYARVAPALLPLNTPHSYGETKPFARELAARLAAEAPDNVTDRTPTALRTGRVLVDWLANDASRSMVASYSLRAADYPTVSAPLRWEEVEAALSTRAPERLFFTAVDFPARLDAVGDPLAAAVELRQRLPH